MLKGKLHMFIFSKRLVSIAASTLVLSLVSASANAQILVLNQGFSGNGDNKTFVSTYTFNQSMILNSIGFRASDGGFSTLRYTLDNTVVNLLESQLGSDDVRFRYYTFSNGGLSVNANSVLTVTTRGDLIGVDPVEYRTYRYDVTSTNLNSNVTYNGMAGNGSSPVTNLTNSNLRVSNPGSNVAPEPGSFALALTGGAALLGICVRRRRNAG